MREFPLFFFERRRVHFNLAWVFEKRHDYGLNFLPKRAIMKGAGGYAMQKNQYDVAAYIWPAYTGDEPRTRIF